MDSWNSTMLMNIEPCQREMFYGNRNRKGSLWKICCNCCYFFMNFENGFNIWPFDGKLLYRHSSEDLVIMAYAWVPEGHVFAVFHGEASRTDINFYSMLQIMGVFQSYNARRNECKCAILVSFWQFHTSCWVETSQWTVRNLQR